MNIAFFGECMVELSGQPLQRTFGGDTLNTALYLSRLGASRALAVSYATALGVDNISRDMLEAWQAEGIDTSMVTKLEDKLPGLYLVETEPSGERHFHYWRNDSAAKFYFSGLSSPLEQAIDEHRFDVLYLSGISLAILAEEAKAILVTLLDKHKGNGGKVLFNNNFRPQLWTRKQAQYWYSQVLPFVDIALLNESDEYHIWGSGDIVERYRRFGCDEVVIRRDLERCKIAANLQSTHARISRVAANKASDIVDISAGSDAFAAGYLAGRLSGHSETAAAELGHYLASIVIRYPGAIIPPEAMKDLM